jgi:peptidylprolyl isomerase
MKKYYLFLACLVLLAVVLMTGCGGPALAKSGDTVKVHYTLKLQDGTVFDSSKDREPLEITLGQNQVIPGFEQAVIGMKAGESKTFTLTADQAYGQRNDELIYEIGKDELPSDINPEVGMQLQGSQGILTILEVNETTVKLDANNPLAGKDLTFEIQLVEIGASQSQESSLTSITLEEALANGKPTIAEFGRGTCIPCKQMKPILEELAELYKDTLNVSIVSVDEYRDLTNYYKVMAIPTQIIFDREGKEITRHVGLWPILEIISKLKEMGIE